MAYGLPDLRSKGRSSVQYLPEGTGFERKPCTTQIPAKGHLRLKGRRRLWRRRGLGLGARPGKAREPGGEPIARLLPGTALPRPRRDSLGGDPRREGAPRLVLQVQFPGALGPAVV